MILTKENPDLSAVRKRSGSIALRTLNNTQILRVWIPHSIRFLNWHWPTRPFGFGKEHRALKLIVFESISRLTRIESEAFSDLLLQSIVIASNVEILGSCCFCTYKSLSSITYESHSRLTRIESEVFSSSLL
jgi:hypothetical protein